MCVFVYFLNTDIYAKLFVDVIWQQPLSHACIKIAVLIDWFTCKWLKWLHLLKGLHESIQHTFLMHTCLCDRKLVMGNKQQVLLCLMSSSAPLHYSGVRLNVSFASGLLIGSWPCHSFWNCELWWTGCGQTRLLHWPVGSRWKISMRTSLSSSAGGERKRWYIKYQVVVVAAAILL